MTPDRKVTGTLFGHASPKEASVARADLLRRFFEAYRGRVPYPKIAAESCRSSDWRNEQ